jgi:hypothetical protein
VGRHKPGAVRQRGASFSCRKCGNNTHANTGNSSKRLPNRKPLSGVMPVEEGSVKDLEK